MKVTIKNYTRRKEKENRFIKSFAKFYLLHYFPQINKMKEIYIECPEPAPDYFLPQLKIAVEIKEVHDREEIEKIAATNRNVKRLQEGLDILLQEEEFLKGIYFLEYPWGLKIEKGKEREVAQMILNAIKNNQQEFDIKDVGVFKIMQKSENKETRIILAFSMGPRVWINSSLTLHQNIAPHIAKANNQLSLIKANKKILLLVNKFGEEISKFIEALSYSYRDLLEYKNIDEIWLQIKDETNQFYHTLLYKRDFLNSFNKCNLKLIDKDEISLYEKWFYPLSKLGDEYKEKLFITLKQFLKDKKPYEVFCNEFLREQIVELGIWLAKNKKFNDTIWIIDKFIDDPNPEEPEKYTGDPKFNYHQQIANGEDVLVITTVLGRLAWIVQELAICKEYISKALDYTRKLLIHKNFYVKLQAIVPLIKISARRQWLEGWGKRPRTGQYKKFHDLVFNLLDFVKEHPNCKAIGRRLCYVFTYYKDLSTEEAEQVVDTLKITDEAAGLFVYFGIFRQRHCKDQPIEYNGEILQEKLKEMIKNKKNEFLQLRTSIAWYLWKILNKNPDEFEAVKPYIDLILEQSYERNIYSYIERIIKDWIKDKPNICIRWYKQMLFKFSEFVEKTEKFQLKDDLWLHHNEEIVEIIAENNSKKLLEIIRKLVSIWEKGIYIGSLKRLFESYKFVPIESIRIEIKKKFQKLYYSLKKRHSKIETVNWD